MSTTYHASQTELNRSPTMSDTSFLSRRFGGLRLSHHGSGGESSEDTVGPLGLTLLHEPSEPLIDFIFVHGLGGGSRKTWSKTENAAHFWPKQWLPTEPRFRHVRIHSFGYNSQWIEMKASILTIHDFGQALLGEIQNSPSMNQRNDGNPIVLVGHSMGGLVIKKVLLLAKQDPNYHQIAARIHSMFFLATPHRGADSARYLSNVIKISVSHGRKPYIDNLIPNSEAIQIINDEFRHVYHGTQLWSFFETDKTSLGLIVKKDSAVLGLPGERVSLLNADHCNVCKFENPSDSNYCTVRNAFVFAIGSITKTWLSASMDNQRAEMKLLSTYMGLLESPEGDFASIVDQQTEGSCCWLTNTPSFLAWQQDLRDSPNYFWLRGEPATGKSTVAGHVTKYLEGCNSDCSYFFFKHGNTCKSTVAALLCSLAWQMASNNTEIRRKLLEMCGDGVSLDKGDEGSIWRAIFMRRIFHTDLRQTHYWVVDALDECTNISALFPLLAKIDKQFPLRIFITSRPSLAIERSILKEKIPITTESMALGESLADMKLFLQTRAPYLPVENETDRQELIARILGKSNGNFLWTSLVVRELEEAYSEQRVHEILGSVPHKLNDLYSRILNSLSAIPQNAELAKAMLRWVVCAARPLAVEELREALKLDTGQTLLQLEKSAGAICGNLVHVNLQSRVQLTHHTVKEFFLGDDHDSEWKMLRPREHSRLAEICLTYLCSNEMKTPWHRRHSLSLRSTKRSAFADYATSHFSEHIVRSSLAEDKLMIALDSFLQTNSLTWIEVVATRQDLTLLTRTAKNLKTYLDRRNKYRPPLGVEVQRITAWANDLIHLVAQFGKILMEKPSSIYFLIPSVCPQDSMIFRSSNKNARSLQVNGLSQKEWDDRLCCIIFPEVRPLTLACRDDEFAIGFSDGIIRIYHEATFQEQRNLSLGEPVRRLAFASSNPYLASAGRRKISVWNTLTGTHLWDVDISDQPLALEFSEDETTLMAATKANILGFWNVANGVQSNLSDISNIEEEDSSEYHYWGPPTHAAFSAGLNILGVTSCWRPISFWELEDKEYIGQFHKSRPVFPGPSVVAFIFNPKPEINLAAAAYFNGDVIVFDPQTNQVSATADTDASVLAASPDGTVLATGSGDGVIRLYDFETLSQLYQINTQQQDIRAIAFNSNSLRFFDIRGNLCNVWEPSVLVRRIDSGHDSSVDFSERDRDGPQLCTARTFDEDLAISAMVAPHGGNVIFCGREDGSVATYSSETGLPVQELFRHVKNVAVTSLEWNEREDLLASVDEGFRCIVRKVLKTLSGALDIGQPILDRTSLIVISQVLLSTNGKRCLISTPKADELWDLDDALLIYEHVPSVSRSSWRWISHPLDCSRLFLVTDGRAKVFDWANLAELSKPEGIDLGLRATPDFPVTYFAPAAQDQNVCICCSGSKATGLTSSLSSWSAESLSSESSHAEPVASYDDLVKDIKGIIGMFKSNLIFLNDDGWICSLNTQNMGRGRVYTRHFYVPLQWHSMTPAWRIPMLVTKKGSIALAVGNEIAVFHNGLDFEEQVALEGSPAPVKASMRSVLGQGGSSST
ncbi:MAG: hypothetical protein M1837_007190 [Sclerophora amabilis]|nr:MAG: hypothetical protein M1837_007190 [Sclerophora amabilis]